MFHFRKDGEIVKHGISFYKYYGDKLNRAGIGILINFPLWTIPINKHYDVLKDAFFLGMQRLAVHFSVGTNGIRFCVGHIPIGQQTEVK